MAAAAPAAAAESSSRTLPADGRLPAYREQSRRLVFGEGQGERIATIQTLGGSGALKVGADFPRPGSRKPACGSAIQPGTTTRASSAAPVLKSAPILTTRLKPTAWPSTPCWPSCAAAGRRHRRAARLLPQPDRRGPQPAAVARAGAGGTGARPAAVLRHRLPGFGDGIDEDAFAIRYFAEQGIPLLVASSYSKNFAIYGERCGALHVTGKDADEALKVFGQLQSAVRKNYSSPPAYGGRVIATVLATPAARPMGSRTGRHARAHEADPRELYAQLKAQLPGGDFEYLRIQQGMFSFTGLPVAQIRKLRDAHGVYLIESGRVCLAALSSAGVTPVARAIVQVMTEN
jgi:aromatic-amino-acid transaminase